MLTSSDVVSVALMSSWRLNRQKAELVILRGGQSERSPPTPTAASLQYYCTVLELWPRPEPTESDQDSFRATAEVETGIEQKQVHLRINSQLSITEALSQSLRRKF
ncbi:hypothetical protein CHU98_g11678 [Xylaria longipes]|nr:hypothetical protein CHU98_g11678 [Xylaria longipes]